MCPQVGPTEKRGALALEPSLSPFCLMALLPGRRARCWGRDQLGPRSPALAGPTWQLCDTVMSPNSVHTPCHRHGCGQVQFCRPGHAGALTARRRRGEDLQPHRRGPGLVEGRDQWTGEWPAAPEQKPGPASLQHLGRRAFWLRPGWVRAGSTTAPPRPTPAPCSSEPQTRASEAGSGSGPI